MPLKPNLHNSTWMETPEYVFAMDAIQEFPGICSPHEYVFEMDSIREFPRICSNHVPKSVLN